MKNFIKSGFYILVFIPLLWACKKNDPTPVSHNPFSELTENGSITLTYNGTSPNDEPFKSTIAYNNSYPPSTGKNNVTFDTDVYSFFIKRFKSIGDDESFTIDFFVQDLGLDTEQASINNVTIIQPIIFDGNKYFEIYNTVDTFVSQEVTNISYNDNTGKLTFDFSVVIAGDKNTTGNTLTIDGKADVIVYEVI